MDSNTVGRYDPMLEFSHLCRLLCEVAELYLRSRRFCMPPCWFSAGASPTFETVFNDGLEVRRIHVFQRNVGRVDDPIVLNMRRG
jgi:hypothetical protein